MRGGGTLAPCWWSSLSDERDGNKVRPDTVFYSGRGFCPASSIRKANAPPVAMC